MCFTLVGGMDRLKPDYISVARERGHELKCISRNERNFTDKLGNPDAVIVFTNKISHEAKRKAMLAAKTRGIPVRLVHSCGISTLRECLEENN